MNKKINDTIDNIFRINIRVKKSERVLIFSDAYTSKIREIAELVTERGKNFTMLIEYVKFPPTGCHGTEPPETLWHKAFGENVVEKLQKNNLLGPILKKEATDKQIEKAEKIINFHKNDARNVIIALSYFSTSHTRFRDFLSRICNARYASMPLFDMNMLTGAMRVDWQKMAKKSSIIKKIISKYENIEISSPNGTLITMSRKGRKVMEDTGILTKPGSFSNLPAGEVFLAPLEGSANGILVLDWAPTRKLKKPVSLYITKGNVTRVDGDEIYVEYLNEKLSEKIENQNIAELGIGTNDKASRPDNILESEKISGTVHIALGDNSSFGGRIRTSFHQDFVLFDPTVLLSNAMDEDRRTLMKNGRFLIRE